MTLHCLEHTLDCSGGRRGSFDNISANSADKQGREAQAGYGRVEMLDLCDAALLESKAPLRSHLRVNVADFVGKRGREKKNWNMKCRVLTGGGRFFDSYDRSAPPVPVREDRREAKIHNPVPATWRSKHELATETSSHRN